MTEPIDDAPPPLIYVCCWCDYRFPPDGLDPQHDYESCPHCHGSYSFGKPRLVDLGAFI